VGLLFVGDPRSVMTPGQTETDPSGFMGSSNEGGEYCCCTTLATPMRGSLIKWFVVVGGRRGRLVITPLNDLLKLC